MEVVTHFDSTAVNHGSSCVLFVEGGKGSVDVTVLSEIIPFVNIRPIGASFHLKAVATAFKEAHPEQYFLIDRDHEDDDTVERSWNDFAAGKTNLLIWRKKEIENYFLAPDFLLCSEFIRENVSAEVLQTRIVDFTRERIYMFVVNRVIAGLREELKQKWIEFFQAYDKFPNAEVALKSLLEAPELVNRPGVVADVLSRKAIEHRFRGQLSLLLGEPHVLEWGKGRWLDLVPGKDVLKSLLLDAQLFNGKIPGQSRPVQGDEKMKLILRRLLRNAVHGDGKLPSDFDALRDALRMRLAKS